VREPVHLFVELPKRGVRRTATSGVVDDDRDAIGTVLRMHREDIERLVHGPERTRPH
jgi:hypothetical protein